MFLELVMGLVVLTMLLDALNKTLGVWIKRRHNYWWYRRAYPRFAFDGGVACCACGGARIHARALMQRSYLREHFCAQCGATLYYSREG